MRYEYAAFAVFIHPTPVKVCLTISHDRCSVTENLYSADSPAPCPPKCSCVRCLAQLLFGPEASLQDGTALTSFLDECEWIGGVYLGRVVPVSSQTCSAVRRSSSGDVSATQDVSRILMHFQGLLQCRLV